MSKYNWEELKKSRIFAPVSLMLGMAAAIGAMFLVRSPILSSVIMLLAMGIAVFFGFKIYLFDCPNCKNKFFIGKSFQNIFSNKCKHCGTKVGE